MMINEIYKQILKRVCPDDILDLVLDIDKEEELNWFNKSLEYNHWLDEFFEKYKFKPKYPELYKRTGMNSDEEEELYRLIKLIPPISCS